MRQPFKHQTEALQRSLNRKTFALFFEQRCGKTKVIIDTAAAHFKQGTINGAIVIAWPNGVQHVWNEEWPKDWPESEPYKLVAWRSHGIKKQILDDLLNFQGMSIFTINCEAMKPAWTFISQFFKRRRLLVVADESSWGKTPSAERTKRLLALGRHKNAVLRRILDGTPADEGPFDLWAPCAFLDLNLLGYPTFFGFKAHFGEYKEGYAPGGRKFKQLVTHRNLDELNEKLSHFSMRVKRSDISDAPPKIYRSLYFELTPKIRKVYDRLRDEYIADLNIGEQIVENVLKRMIRLQMVARNYYPPEEVGIVCKSCLSEGFNDSETCEICDGLGIIVEKTKLERIDKEHHPAQDVLIQELKQINNPVVIWAKFRQDVTDVIDALELAGRTSVRFDGTVSAHQREEAYQAFINGEVDSIAATVGSGLSRGRNLTRAGSIIYYSNDFGLRTRRQSEDRAESLSRKISTDIVDLVAENTRDIDIITALRDKKSLAELIMGDPPEQWL